MKHTLRILLLFALNFSAIYAQKPTERALICGTNEGGLSQESLDIIKNAQNYLTKRKLVGMQPVVNESAVLQLRLTMILMKNTIKIRY
jgi:hypothetical protein